MVKKVEWSDRAQSRLQQIYDYLFDVAGERTARKITGKIYSRATILSANPLAGQKETVLTGSGEEFRYLVEGNHKIIYWVEPERVIISTVFDCRQNPEKMKEEIVRRAK